VGVVLGTQHEDPSAGSCPMGRQQHVEAGPAGADIKFPSSLSAKMEVPALRRKAFPPAGVRVSQHQTTPSFGRDSEFAEGENVVLSHFSSRLVSARFVLKD
jgi:hypothetical protein